MRPFTVLTFIVVATASSRAPAQVSDSVARRIDGVYARYASPSSPGCVVGVFQNGKITYEKGYGSANIEYDAPITPRTPFIMGSVTKQFTAAAIALLIDDG